jgi:hypothetical protein
MSVDNWSPAKRIAVEVRKLLLHAKVGDGPCTAEICERTDSKEFPYTGETPIAHFRKLGGSLWFTDDALILEDREARSRVQYAAVERVEWISPDPESKLRLKKSEADTFYLFHSEGCLVVGGFGGSSIQPLHNFFGWLAVRNGARAHRG